MKPLQGDSVNNNSCSCTSCDSGSESDRQTLKRLLVQASRINRLLTGKYYIHLRDSNLLDKLIKTRALYDALRSQLLSSSESSIADLMPRQSSREVRKSFVEAKKSSDIYTLVDLVDKGAVIGLKKLSECCSCCTCSSKFRLHENVHIGRRNRQAQAGGNIASRSSLVSKQETGETKNIKSDPCTCACYKHEKINKSGEITEKIRPRKQIIIPDRLSTASNNHKLMSLNNGKLRKSYHKLKRASGRSPCIENIGEGGNKTMRKSNSVKKTKSIELLKLAQKTIIDSYKTDRQPLKKKEPVAMSMLGNTAEESMIPATKSKDLVVKRQEQSPELKKRLAHRSRKKNTNECICKISDISSTSNISILKETPFITGNEQQKNHSRAKKSNNKFLQQPANLAESNTEISKKAKESYALGGSNQVQKSKESKLPPQKDPAEVVNKKNKQMPFSSTPGKELIKSNTVTIPGIQKSVSINSIKKSHPSEYRKKSSNSLNKINKSILKPRSLVFIRKRIVKEPARHTIYRLLQEVLRPSEETRRHKKPFGLKQKEIKTGSHALKRCICTLKLKINETKSRISKNVSNITLNVKDKQSIKSKNLLSSVKTLIKESNLNLHEPKYMSGYATNCECSDYVNQSEAIRRNKRPIQNETNAHLEIKYNVTNDKQSIQYDRAPDIFNKKKLSIHASMSDCICKELEEFMYRHGQPNVEFGVNSTSNHRVSNNRKDKTKTQSEHADTDNSYNINSSIHASECECFDVNISSEQKGRYKNQRCKSNTRLRTKSALKDASITTEKPGKLQNQSVQTVINITAKQKQEIKISLKQLEKKNQFNCNPRFSIELSNKGFSNNGLKIIQSKVNFVNKCGDGIRQLPNKQSQTSSSSQRSKCTRTKLSLRRCFCTLQLGKKENKKYYQTNVSKVKMIQPKSNFEGSRSKPKLKPVRHDNMTYKYDISICNPKKCFSRQLKVASTKREERNSKKRIKTKLRSCFSLTSRSMQLPRNKKIHYSENLTPILNRNKTKSSNISTHRVRPIFSRKLFRSKRSSCLCSAIDKDNKKNKDTKIRYTKHLQKSMLLRFDLKNKRCLCTFKLRKKGKHYKKSSAVKTDTKFNIIADKINPKFQKGTNLTKSIFSNQLRPYESKYLEPFILEKNKSNSFKQFGIVTKNKMKSKSSDTRTLRSKSKLLFVKTDSQQRNTSLQNFKKMRKYSELSHLPQHAREMYLHNFLKQRVKLGSNFSFNIEFYKGTTPENNFNQNRSKNMNVNFLHNKQEDNLLTKRYSSNRNTHLGIKRVSPTPNRCLCTLKISKMDEQLRNSKLLLPFGTKKLTQVYAMSTVAIAENKIKSPEILVGHEFHCIDSYYPTYSKNVSSHTKQWQYFKKNSTSGLSLSMIAFKTKNVQSYIRESKYKFVQISSRDQSLLDFASNESVRFETAFNCEIDYQKNIRSEKRRILRSAQSQNDTLALWQRSPENPETEKAQNITRLSQLTGIQPLLRRCFCTMNIKVARQKRKLLDYECEPGICIPGECDPYECQKLIMKRLMRQVSRMSGTESRLRSNSSETSSTGSHTRKLQSGFGEPKVPKHRTRGNDLRSRPQGLKYQTLPRSARVPAPGPQHRQAVRVGSTFSFDIEFSKGGSKSAPTKDFVKVPKRQTSSRSTTYHRHGKDRGTRYGGRRNLRENQSGMKQMRHRASNVTPMLERCFCTLKLQKKGRQQKEWELRGTDHGTSTPPKFSVDKSILRTTERSQNTKRKRRLPELLPYECEPGICVPGECDPYECLELIKRRNKHTKDFGTDSMASSISSSSMTSSQKRKRKRIQSRNIRAKQVRSRDTSVRPRPSVMSIDRPGQDRQDHDRPSRQAVKISSNFSFNVQFYKDKTGPRSESDTGASEVYVQKPPKARRVPKNVYAHRTMRESSSQHGKRTRDDDSQIGVYQRGRSTMTSGFLKRCVCTAKLQGINVEAAGARQRRPMAKLKQCFCTLKLMSVSKRRRRRNYVGHERATPIIDKRVGMTQTRESFPVLLPSECESGVCEPSLCDPHECITLKRKRLAKETMTGTAGPRTKSTSSHFSSSNPSRARMTQSRSARRRKRGRRRDYAPGERVLQEKVVSSVSPQRQAVRIGSNFSFNIEFYKDKGSHNLEVQAAAPLVKKSRLIRMRDSGHGAYGRIKSRDRGLRGRRFPALSRDTHMDPTKSRDMGLGPILRRCFCTLKLQKPSKTKAVTKAAFKTASNAEAKVETKAETKTIQKETGGSTKNKKSTHKNTCLCDITDKKEDTDKKEGTPPIKEVATLHTKSVMTAKKSKESIVTLKKPKRRKAFSHKLEPYECEPGICLPGECDPYECLKLINKRLMYSSGTSTDLRGTVSTSNMTNYGRVYRHSETQSLMQRKKPMRTRDTRTRDRERTAWRRARGRKRDYAPRESVLQETVVSPVSPQRQAVRIGSNFSFNIEFYKDKGPHNLEVQAAAPLVKKSRLIRMRDGGHGAYGRIKTRDRGLRGRRFPALSRDTHMDPTKSRDMTLGPILRRCFCTLKLQKQSKTKAASNAKAKVETKAETKTIQKETGGGTKKKKFTHKNTCLCDITDKKEDTDTLKLQKQSKTKAEAKVKTRAETNTIQKLTESKEKKKKHKKEDTDKKEGTPPIKEVATLHTKSVMTTKKSEESIVTLKKPKRRKAFSHKLEPYECEPGICVPGECDPYECLKLINKRLMYSSGTSTDIRGTVSTSNMTNYGRVYRHSETQSLMQRKKPMRTRDTRTRDRERRPYGEKRAYRERRPESRSTEYRSTVVEQSTKQAVKLGSNFNFDIEFFKDTSHGGPVVTSRPIKRDAAYDKPRRTRSRSTEWRSIYSRNKKAQLSRANRDMDSQALGPSMRSTMTGTIAPFLKRCFCTLQLHCKTDNQGSPFDCLSIISKREKVKSHAKKRRESSSAQASAYTRNTAQFHGRKLKPYECESGVCVPGECDPYECIKRRMHSKQASIESLWRSLSRSTDEEKKNIPKIIQAKSHPRQRNDKTRCDDQCQGVTGSRSISSSSDERRKHIPRLKARSYSPGWRYKNTNQTSRRNGKTTRYHDQFQVDNSPQRQVVRIGSNISFNIEFFKDKSPQVPSVREVNKIDNNLNRRSAKKEKVARSKPSKRMSSLQPQLKTDTKGTGTALLKRGFFTLKLEKKGKQRYITPTKINRRRSASTNTKSKIKAEIEPVAREIGTKTKNKNCKCYAIIQKKPNQCKCYNSPKANASPQKLCQCKSDNSPKANRKKTCECIKEIEPFPCKEGKECKCCICNTYALKTNGFPCKKGKECKCCKCNTPLKQDQNIVSVKQDTFSSKKGKESKSSTPLQQDQNIVSVKQDKFSSKKGKESKINTPLKQDQNIILAKKDRGPRAIQCKCNIIKTSDKKTSTKVKYDPLQKIYPSECENALCKPGTCSPECINKKGIRRMSGTPDMSIERTSRLSNMAAQLIPGYTHKRVKYNGEPYSPENIESIVEEPRYPVLVGKNAKQGVKISSNFSFNIEFFKEILPPVVDSDKKVDNNKDSPRRNGDKKIFNSTEPACRCHGKNAVAMKRKCLCTHKLIHPQPLAVCRVEEIRPMPFFQPREYWVQYQTQQTKKIFKTNPQELETIMSYAPCKYDKINNNKECRCCRKTNFGRVDPTKKGARLYEGKQSEPKQSTLKKIVSYCKNLFTKRSNKQNIKNTEGSMEFKKKATNEQPLIDILKPSKSERHQNKAAIADIKKSKSLKVGRGSGKDHYKNKYSRFQSGDHQGTKSQNTGRKLKKHYQHCQIKFKHSIPIHEKVRITTLRTNKALKCKPNDAIVTEQKKDTNPVSFLFKTLKLKNSDDIKYLKLCSCCGGIKTIKNLPSARNFMDIKKKILEYNDDTITTVIPKDLIAIPTKIDIPEEKTALTQENQNKNKQACPCCVCNPKTKEVENGGLGVYGSVICKREPERRTENTHHAECIKCKRRRTSIRSAESEKEALATESGYYWAPNQKNRKKIFEQEAKTRGNFHKAEDKAIIEKKLKEKRKSKKLPKYKNMPDSLLVAESVLDISKLELTSTGDISSNLHRALSDPKGTYRKCQSYLRDPMRAWYNFQKPANNGPSVETLQFLKLRCQAKKCVKEGKEMLEDYPVTNFAKQANNADRKKVFHPKKPSWRRHLGCGFGWSPFQLSLRKRPWLSGIYKRAGSYPHCLTILQVWRQFMDVILFSLAVAMGSPFLLGIELCRALKCCVLCTG